MTSEVRLSHLIGIGMAVLQASEMKKTTTNKITCTRAENHTSRRPIQNQVHMIVNKMSRFPRISIVLG